MKRFRIYGLWSLTKDGKITIPGVLRNGPSGLHLNLSGSFAKGWGATSLGHHDRVYGVVGRGIEGKYVTLLDCIATSSSVTDSGIRREKWLCHHAIVGSSLAPEESIIFDSVHCKFSHLADWIGAGRTGLKSSFTQWPNFQVQYNETEPINFEANDTSIRIRSDVEFSQSAFRFTMRESSVIEISPVEKNTVKEAGVREVRILQNFLTFATNHPNEVEQVLLEPQKNNDASTFSGATFSRYSIPIFRTKRPKNSLHPQRMLFNLNEAADWDINVFKRWFDFSKNYKSFLDKYFSDIYRPPNYMDYRFQNILASIGLLREPSRIVSEKTSGLLDSVNEFVTGQFSDREKRWLSPSLPISHDIEMPFIMLELLNEHSETMSRLINNFEEFIDKVCATLDECRRHSENPGEMVLNHEKLHDAVEKMRWLIKFVILKKLGFNEEHRRKIAERNHDFMFVATR